MKINYNLQYIEFFSFKILLKYKFDEKKILVIGKKSFIGSYIKKNLAQKISMQSMSFENTYKKKIDFFNQFTHVINTSIHKFYVKKNIIKNMI